MASSSIRLCEQDGSLIANPPAGKFFLFLDLDGTWKKKDSTGAITPAYSQLSNEKTGTAGENLSADRVVVQEATGIFYFDPTDSSHYGRVIGITKTAAAIGNPVLLSFNHLITLGTTLTVGQEYFAGASGVLLTSPPATGLTQRIGVACTTSELKFELYLPIIKI